MGHVPPQEAIERRLVTQKAAARVEVPFDYDPDRHQSIRRYFLRLDPPDYSDQTDDWSRVTRELARQGLKDVRTSLPVLRQMGAVLRGEAIELAAAATAAWRHGAGSRGRSPRSSRWIGGISPTGPAEVLALLPGDQTDRNFGAAVDIGTTTVTVWLVDLESGEVVAQTGDYNGQIARGEDVISRIIYAKKPGQLEELQGLVVGTINRLLDAACKQVNARPAEIFKVTVAANPTMMHLLLAIPPEQIRLAPFIPAVNHTPTISAAELGLTAHPRPSSTACRASPATWARTSARACFTRRCTSSPS